MGMPFAFLRTCPANNCAVIESHAQERRIFGHGDSQHAPGRLTRVGAHQIQSDATAQFAYHARAFAKTSVRTKPAMSSAVREYLEQLPGLVHAQRSGGGTAVYHLPQVGIGHHRHRYASLSVAAFDTYDLDFPAAQPLETGRPPEGGLPGLKGRDRPARTCSGR